MHRWSDMTEWGPKGAGRSDTPRFCKPGRPKKLGSGAFKQVYRAYDCINGEEVAWSEVGIGHLSGLERSKVLREVKMMKQLKHENLIDLIDQWFDKEHNKVVIITALGVPLRKFVERWSGAIELSLVRKWARDVIQGLAYMHSRGIVHRDMKMENLLLVKGKVVITDYGLARELAGAADLERLTSYIGTPAFMAPELYQDDGYNNSVDIYAFGMVMLELITAEMPYTECGGAPAKIMFKTMHGTRPDSLKTIRCPIARKLIEQCISMDPKKRPTAQAIVSEHPFFHVSDEYLNKASRPFVVPAEDSDVSPSSASEGESSQGGPDNSNATQASTNWLPPVLVYDPLQVLYRSQLKEKKENSPGANVADVEAYMEDLGDDFGPELNQEYQTNVELAETLGQAIVKDYNGRVADLVKIVSEVADGNILSSSFRMVFSEHVAGMAASFTKSLSMSLRERWPGAEEEYAEVVQESRVYLNSVPSKVSDALQVSAGRNAKSHKARIRKWCMSQAFHVVANSVRRNVDATGSESTLSPTGDAPGTMDDGEDPGETTPIAASNYDFEQEMASLTRDQLAQHVDRVPDQPMHPNNATPTDSVAGTAGSTVGTVGTQSVGGASVQHTRSDSGSSASSSSASSSAVFNVKRRGTFAAGTRNGAPAKPRSRSNTAGTDEILDRDTVFAFAKDTNKPNSRSAPTLRVQTDAPAAATGSNPSTPVKDAPKHDPFEMLVEDYIGNGKNGNQRTLEKSSNGHSPQVMLAEDVIAAISPSGKIQYEAKSSKAVGGKKMMSDGVATNATTARATPPPELNFDSQNDPPATEDLITFSPGPPKVSSKSIDLSTPNQDADANAQHQRQMSDLISNFDKLFTKSPQMDPLDPSHTSSSVDGMLLHNESTQNSLAPNSMAPDPSSRRESTSTWPDTSASRRQSSDQTNQPVHSKPQVDGADIFDMSVEDAAQLVGLVTGS